MIWAYVAAVAGGYLLGSVSFAWLVARARGVDLRKHGSGNLGATNAGRVLGWRWFPVVFVGDFAKGFGPTLGLSLTLPELPHLGLACGGGAILGHVFTCFHGLCGGKAVATSVGVIVATAPLVAGVTFALWALVWLVAKGCGARTDEAISPASILAAAAAPVAAWFLVPDPLGPGGWPVTAAVGAMALLILLRHVSNMGEILGKMRGEDRGERSDRDPE